MKGILLPDLHWGATNPKQFRQELDECIFTKIKELDELDFIIFLGDFWDSKQYLSSDTTSYGLCFIQDIIEATQPFNTEIVMIEGTKTHDALQTAFCHKIFHDIDGVSRFNAYSKVTELTNFCGKQCNVLLIPEEYILDQDAYYEEYFQKRYDFIFGHGMVDKIWYAKRNKDSQSSISKYMSAPVFGVDELLKVGRYVYFGHIHSRLSYGDKNRFKYGGPVTSWEFGKNETPGYYLIDYNENTGSIYEEFIENNMAPVLITKAISINETISLTDLNKMIDNIIAREMSYADKLRLIINIDPSIDNFNSIKDFLTTKLGEMNYIKFVISTDNCTDTDTIHQKIAEEKQTKGYVFDRNLDIESRIQQFINSHSGKDISIGKIKMYLSMKK